MPAFTHPCLFKDYRFKDTQFAIPLFDPKREIHQQHFRKVLLSASAIFVAAAPAVPLSPLARTVDSSCYCHQRDNRHEPPSQSLFHHSQYRKHLELAASTQDRGFWGSVISSFLNEGTSVDELYTDCKATLRYVELTAEVKAVGSDW